MALCFRRFGKVGAVIGAVGGNILQFRYDLIIVYHFPVSTYESEPSMDRTRGCPQRVFPSILLHLHTLGHRRRSRLVSALTRRSTTTYVGPISSTSLSSHIAINYSFSLGGETVAFISHHVFNSSNFLPDLTGGDHWMYQEGTEGEPTMHSLVGGPPIGYEHPTGWNKVIDWLLAQPPISTHFPNAGNSASTATSCINVTEPYPSESLLQFPMRTVGSAAMRAVSIRRRKRDAVVACSIPGCTATFTAKHNLNRPYFFTGNISSN